MKKTTILDGKKQTQNKPNLSRRLVHRPVRRLVHRSFSEDGSLGEGGSFSEDGSLWRSRIKPNAVFCSGEPTNRL